MSDPSLTHHDITREPVAQPSGELHFGGSHIVLRGCAFQLVFWIAHRQHRINTAADSGQLILNWKGARSPSITGEIRTRL